MNSNPDLDRRPLSGIRVLDLTRGMPGAVTTMLLADYGAEVVLVESPWPSLMRRTGGHSMWGRGKHSIVLDLGTATDRAQAAELAAGADVVIEDHRPGKLDAWGLGADAVTELNPDVIYCSITGHTDATPDQVPTDAAVAAKLGVLNEWGGTREGPIFLGHPALDYAAAMLAGIAVLASIRARLVDGRGERVAVSLEDAALALYPMNWWSEKGGESIDRKSPTGDLRFGNKRLLLRSFECADGRRIQVHTGAAGAFDRAMEVFGLGDEVSKTDGPVQMLSLLTDHDLEVLEHRLPEIMRTRTVDEWLHLLWEHQVAALPIGEPGEALDDDQARYAGIITKIDDPALGTIEVVGPAVLMSESPGTVTAPAPTPDQHGHALRAHGWSTPGLSEVRGAAPLTHPMDGIRIIEFSTFFAAPYGNRLLSDLGAQIVKIEGVDGDPMRPLHESYQGANRGKLDLAANLKDRAVLDAVHRLVATADVIGHNLRPGAAERLGLDAGTLRAINPDLIYHYSPGYGSSGPKSGLQSFAPLLSGYVGVFAIGAGIGNRPHATFGNEDYYNGLLGACACLLGIIHRERTGVSQVVESPQLHSSLFTTSEYYKHGDEYRSVIPRLGGDLFGWTAGYRLYQTLDAWICVTCVHDHQVAALADAVVPPETLAGLPADALHADAPERGPLAKVLEYHMVERLADEWVDTLRAAGVPVESVRDDSWLKHDAFHDDRLIATGRITPITHPTEGPAHIVGHLVRPTVHVPVADRGRAPKLGEHTISLLTEAGCDEAEIATLISTGCVTAD